jgi:hypothetical protein
MYLLIGILIIITLAVWCDRPYGFRFLRLHHKPAPTVDLDKIDCIPCSEEATRLIETEISRLQMLSLQRIVYIDPTYLTNLIALLETHTCEDPPGRHETHPTRPRRRTAGEVHLLKKTTITCCLKYSFKTTVIHYNNQCLYH